MREIPINAAALIVAAVVRMALGALWYSPIAFGPLWRKLAGMTEAQVKAGVTRALVVDVVGSLIMAFVLLHAVVYAGATTLGQGLAVGFFNWLGFIAVVTLAQVLYEQRPLRLFVVNNGFQLLALLLMGAILAVWH